MQTGELGLHCFISGYYPINLESVEILKGAKLEPTLAEEATDARFQFVRTGYFIKDSKHEGVYNRIVSLKDSYPKK